MTQPRTPPWLLLVEDEHDARELLAELLGAEGYLVRTASHGGEALALLDGDLPALIITDLRMPVMDGWELIARLRATDGLRAIPIAVLTAESTGPAGCEIFQKPLKPARLLEFVARYLDPDEPDRASLRRRAIRASDEMLRITQDGTLGLPREMMDAVVAAAAALIATPHTTEALVEALERAERATAAVRAWLDARTT